MPREGRCSGVRADDADGGRTSLVRGPHAGPVPAAALALDAETRAARGRVRVLNATKADGLDGWTMDLEQWRLVREHILETIDAHARADGSVPLQLVVDAAQARFAGHPAFPKGRLTNYVRYTKVDLEARCEIERVPGSSPQRIMRWREAPTP